MINRLIKFLPDLLRYLANILFQKRLIKKNKIRIENFKIYGPLSMTRYYNAHEKIITEIKNSTYKSIKEINKIRNNHFIDDKINIFDIGANIGIYSIAYAQIPFSEVFSFEPFPETYNYLHKNKLINNQKNINTYKFGLFNESKMLTMGGPNKNYSNISDWVRKKGDEFEIGCKTIYHDSTDDKAIKCQFINGDKIVEKIMLNKLHFIKIDTEGSEFDVLHGLKKTLEKMKPIIQLELNINIMAAAGVKISDIRELLIKLGYTNFKMCNDKVKQYMPLEKLSNRMIKGSKDYIFY